MGCSFIFSRASSSSYEPKPKLSRLMEANPNPENFEIKKIEQINEYIIVKINYPDCKNYEGNKILVFRHVSMKDVMDAKIIDPHFFDDRGIKSPIARFVPTDEGWEMAISFCSYYYEDE